MVGTGVAPLQCPGDFVEAVCHMATGFLVKGLWLCYALLLFFNFIFVYLFSLCGMETKQIILSEIALFPRESMELLHKAKSCSARNQSLSMTITRRLVTS